MKLNVYSIFDKVATAYLQPFYMNNDEMAIRAVKPMLFDEEHMFAQNPQDYCLYCLGSFDDSNGHLESNITSLGYLTNFKDA